MESIYGEGLGKDKACNRRTVMRFIKPKYTDDRKGKIDFNKHTFIGGHFYVDKYLHLKDKGWKFVTWMREPIDRIVSHYDHYRRWYITGNHKKGNEEIWKYFKDPSFTIVKFSKIFSNYQSRFIKDIELFDFIGIVERFDSDYNKFCDMFDLERMEYKTLNINPIERTVINDTQRQIMERHHKDDYEIYKWILKGY